MKAYLKNWHYWTSQVKKIETNKKVISVSDYLQDQTKLLFDIEHHQLQTQFDFSGVNQDLDILTFNENFEFLSMKPFKSGYEGGFSILMPEKIVLITSDNDFAYEIESYGRRTRKKNIPSLNSVSNNKYDEKGFVHFSYFPQGYGRFPYIIFKIHSTIYMQIPIHFIPEGGKVDLKIHPGTHITDVPKWILSKDKNEQIQLLHDKLIDVAKWVQNKIREDKEIEPKLCLVCGKDISYYFEKDSIKFSSAIPSDGTLWTQGQKLLAWMNPHYMDFTVDEELQARKQTVKVGHYLKDQATGDQVDVYFNYETLFHETKENIIKVKDYLFEDTNTYITFKHKNEISQLDFTDTREYLVLFIENRTNLAGVKAIYEETKDRIIRTKAKEVLLILSSSETQIFPYLKETISICPFNSEDLDANQMMEEVHADYYQKLNLLRENNHRYFIKKDVWIEPGELRIVLAKDILKYAKAHKDESLEEKATDTIAFLANLYNPYKSIQ